MQNLLSTLMLATYFAGSLFNLHYGGCSALAPTTSQLLELDSGESRPLPLPPQAHRTILTTYEFELFGSGIASVAGIKCAQDLNRTLRGILDGDRWAIAMYDATVKSAVGLESGVADQFGHYDECVSQKKYINHVNKHNLNNHKGAEPVRAQYCLTNVTMNGMSTHNIASRKKTLNTDRITTTSRWGACLPASCRNSDVATFLQNFLQRPVTVNANDCEVHVTELSVTNAMFNYALVICFFVFLTVMSTGFHAYALLFRRNEKDTAHNVLLYNENLNMVLISFSVIENTKKLFQASKDQLGLNSINGIKAIAMLLILAGHALSFIYGGPVHNAEFIDEQIKLPTFGFLSNSLLFVDTFLLLSGFLFCRILLIELERRRGKINFAILYAARYIRLTPAYAAIIGFYMTWLPQAGDGPIWRQRIVREQERCTASWWLNILYINNYINTDKLCMFQSWYLSVDSQLFFLAPVVIYLLYKSRRHALHVLTVLVSVTTLIPFLVTYFDNLDPTLLVYADEINDLGSNTFYIGSYIKTHMRASAYVMGLLTGFLVHIIQEKGTKLSVHMVRFIWFISSVVGVTCMYSVCRFYARPFSNLESSLYAGFHKLGWNLSVAWLVLASTTGHAGWLQRILSHRLFVPISRLTFCAYLCNGLVELYHSSRVREPRVLGYTNLINDVFCHILDTFALAFVVCLLFESPIHALERILLRKANNRDKHEQRNGELKGNANQTPSTSEEQA